MENFLEAGPPKSKRRGEVIARDKPLGQAGRHSHYLQPDTKPTFWSVAESWPLLSTKDLQNFHLLLNNTENCFRAKSQEEIPSAVFGSANILHCLVYPHHVNFWMALEIFQALADCKLGSKRRGGGWGSRTHI